MKKYKNLSLAITSGLLLWVAWPVSPLTSLIFVAFVPLLWIESSIKNRKIFFGLTYITMFVWNVAATWWIWNASAPGAVAAFFANSFLMCLPWLGFTIVKKWKGEIIGYLSLISFWMCFEFIHLHDWGLSWPWLTLGNVFATHTEWIQWYEYTGVSGGSLWVLLSNVLIFALLKEYKENGRTKKYFIEMGSLLIILIAPVLISKSFSTKIKGEQSNTGNIVVVQPNIDPYTKVSEETGSFEWQLNRLIETSEKEIDNNTVLVVWPETALYTPSGIQEETLKKNLFLGPFWSFLERNPPISLFTGIESFNVFDQKTKYAEAMFGKFVETYNGAMLVDSSGASAFYHKSMLVPGVETLPWFLKFLSSWFEKFGGTTAGYAKQDERTALNEKHGYKIAPAICYESIYGAFMSKYIKNGANLICIITNDGWWKNTPGHEQHESYARLRAIETRTWVARSANTGISCFIDQFGNVIDSQPYNTRAAIKFPVPIVNHAPTFYVRHPDVLFEIMTGISIILFLWITYLKIAEKWFRKKRI
ncbi:MAG: apolipoprotein N-acyltransferase [Bacteroidetes bacterium]|nr:apolipoprotein N-acyltransferase [Bacteroidota bacterium]